MNHVGLKPFTMAMYEGKADVGGSATDESMPMPFEALPLAVLRAQVEERFADVKRPVHPAKSSPIHDPWGLSKLG